MDFNAAVWFSSAAQPKGLQGIFGFCISQADERAELGAIRVGRRGPHVMLLP